MTNNMTKEEAMEMVDDLLDATYDHIINDFDHFNMENLKDVVGKKVMDIFKEVNLDDNVCFVVMAKKAMDKCFTDILTSGYFGKFDKSNIHDFNYVRLTGLELALSRLDVMLSEYYELAEAGTLNMEHAEYNMITNATLLAEECNLSDDELEQYDEIMNNKIDQVLMKINN